MSDLADKTISEFLKDRRWLACRFPTSPTPDRGCGTIVDRNDLEDESKLHLFLNDDDTEVDGFLCEECYDSFAAEMDRRAAEHEELCRRTMEERGG